MTSAILGLGRQKLGAKVRKNESVARTSTRTSLRPFANHVVDVAYVNMYGYAVPPFRGP